MKPPTAAGSDAQFYDWIREHCHQPGVTGVALCQPDQTLLAASFDVEFTEERLRIIWPAASQCITAVRQQGGPAREFLWQGRQRTFWITVRPDGACLGWLHHRDLGTESRKRLEEATAAFQGLVPAASA